MTRKYLRHSRNRAFTSAAADWKFPRLAAAVIGLSLFSPSAQSEGLVDSALRSFLGNDSNTGTFDFDKSRPQAVTADFVTRVVNSLPAEGRVKNLNKAQREKLAALDPILRAHQRDSVYQIRVYEAPQAFVGLHFGAVLLISEPALDLLTAEDLQALAAHEIGHEYVWTQFQEADKRSERRRLKELELFCDGVAILTLRRAGVNPAHLLAGLQKVAQFNRLHMPMPLANESNYPSLEERKKFAEAVMQWAAKLKPEGAP